MFYAHVHFALHPFRNPKALCEALATATLHDEPHESFSLLQFKANGPAALNAFKQYLETAGAALVQTAEVPLSPSIPPSAPLSSSVRRMAVPTILCPPLRR